MHHFIRASDIRPTLAFPAEAAGYRRVSLSDRACGAVHSGWGMCELGAKGHVNQHLQSFEKSFFVVSGNPVLEVVIHADGTLAGIALRYFVTGTLRIGCIDRERARRQRADHDDRRNRLCQRTVGRHEPVITAIA